MWDKIHSRHNLTGIIFTLYALPLTLLSAYGAWVAPSPQRWNLFAIGLLLSFFGTLIFFYLLLDSSIDTDSNDEEQNSCAAEDEDETLHENDLLFNSHAKNFSDDQAVNEELISLQNALDEAHQKEGELLEEISYRNEEIQKLAQEKDLFNQERQRLEQEFTKYRQQSEETLAQETTQSNEYEETISELRSTVEQKQRQIEQLDNKIRDLTYEIKTLLQLADMGSNSLTMSEENTKKQGFAIYESATEYQVPIEAPYFDEEHDHTNLLVYTDVDAKKQLKRCIDIAQKITGSHHFGNQASRFGDLALDNYALDLRRLCDSLRSETVGTIFVYSCKDNKLLFANNQVKELLGWSPEKFVHDFENIVQDGIFEWKSSISQLNTMSYSNTRLVLKAKTGHDLLVHCQLGIIPTGVFRNNVIGVLYQD